MTRPEFVSLLRALADAWRANDPRRAAEAFADDVEYRDPLRYAFRSRAELVDFFRVPEGESHRVVWRTVLFDEAAQEGAVEYTYVHHRRYDGVALVRVAEGRIVRWREYQHARQADAEAEPRGRGTALESFQKREEAMTHHDHGSSCHGPSAAEARRADGRGGGGGPAKRAGYASPKDAMAAPREEVVYVAALHTGTGVDEPDFLAVVDVNPDSDAYGTIVHRTPMPQAGDELHHYGWQVCSSACHTELAREHLIVPGMISSNIHVVNVSEPRRPEIVKVIPAAEVKRKTGLSSPHTIHCMPGDVVVMSMLGDRNGDAPGGMAVLDAKTFDVLGRWESGNGSRRPQFMYDFWYQPRLNTMITSEWTAPNVFREGFKVEDVAAGKYGHSVHFWNLAEKEVVQSVDLGNEGLIPLEVRWQHDPAARAGFVGAALSSAIWRWKPGEDGRWDVKKVIQVESKDVEGWPFPVPGLITDLVLSMDDRYLYFSDWLHGDLRQYDVSDPDDPKLTGQVWLGGVLGHPTTLGRKLDAGPQMLQLSMDGRRLYVSNSLYSAWDNQFYPDMKSWMLKVDCDPAGGMRVDPDFAVDFGAARAHEMHLPGGDCTTEIFQ